MPLVENRVEDRLVVTSPATLPPFCVKTNAPVESADMQRRRLSWCSPFLGLLILISGLLLIVLYFVLRKHCTLTFGLSPAVRNRYRNRRIFKGVAAIVLFFSLPVASAFDSTAVIATVLVLFLVAFISLFIGNSPLTVLKHRNGEFWISGCSRDFLSRVQQS